MSRLAIERVGVDDYLLTVIVDTARVASGRVARFPGSESRYWVSFALLVPEDLRGLGHSKTYDAYLRRFVRRLGGRTIVSSVFSSNEIQAKRLPALGWIRLDGTTLWICNV